MFSGEVFYVRTPLELALDPAKVRRAGALILIGAAQFALFLTVAEATYPGYSVSGNEISDLGATCRSGVCKVVQPSSNIFNVSVLSLGLFLLVGSYYIWGGYRSKPLTLFGVLAGIGNAGVGILSETTGALHTAMSALTFLSIGVFGVLVFRVARPPMSYFSLLAGIATLVAMAPYGVGDYLGLGVGGMERIVVYPSLVNGLALGGYFIGVGEGERR